MHFLYILLIALANNIDNIGVRLAYSIAGIKISLSKNLWVAGITFVISSLAALSGKIASEFLSKRLSAELSAAILISIGLWLMVGPYIKKYTQRNNAQKKNWAGEILDHPEKADLDCSKDIDFKEATLLGVALSINNIGGGLGAGILGLSAFHVGLFSAVISFLALLAGNYISAFFEHWHLGAKATFVAGIFLILIGLKQTI